MSRLVEKLLETQKYAMSIRPQVGGFPILAEVLRQAGVKINRWTLPSFRVRMNFQSSIVRP